MGKKSVKKVFVIGLDGATLNLVKKWTAEDKLPTLARLMSDGVYGHLKTVPNQNSAPAWTSFMTGKNPGKHGIYYFYEKRHNSYNIRYLNGSDCNSETIWTLLSKAGKKVGVLNVPMTYPAGHVNGFMVAGMDAPGKSSTAFTYPDSLANELSKVVPKYVIEPGITGYVDANKYDLAVEMAMSSIGARTKATLYLMEKYAWDFFMVVFRESDVIQHHFWEFMEEGKSEAANVDTSKHSNTILNIYKRLDLELAKIVARLPEDCYILVLSDHGFARAEGGPPYLNYLLRHSGMLEFKDRGHKHEGTLEVWRRRLIKGASSYIQKHTSRRTKEDLLRLFPGLRDKVDSEKYFRNIDWSKTKAFGESSRIELWINLKGREPEGTIQPGVEYDRLCEEIRRKLYQWYDPKTCKRVVKKVFRKEELYHGNHLDMAPDLLIIFEDNIKVAGITLMDEDGKKEYVDVPSDVSDTLTVNGAHRDNGLFIMKGNGIKKGVELQGAEIIDLAPTILYFMEQEIPPDMDGRVLIDALEDGMINRQPVMVGKPSNEEIDTFQKKDYGEDEKKAIEERLRGLGYI